MEQMPVDYHRLMNRMTDIIAHDIRNPLNNILLSTAQFKMDTLPDKEDTAFYIDIIERNCDRISQLLVDIAAVMRQQAAHTDAFDVTELITELVTEYEDKFALKNIRCIWNTQLMIMASLDRSQIKKALQQLMDNALEATGNGGTIELMVEELEQECRITVKDNGEGIAEAVMPYIYIPFFTTRDRHKGLGLTLVKNIVDAHHGRIEVSSGNEGTRFRMVLPG